jgi:hydroxymethylpyrimidine pyrophosphatase-like HAD family hydrolase
LPDYFRAIAVDFDGTLTTGGRPADEALDAIARARHGNRRVLLVTGRILAELRSVFADVDDWFDAIVAENGAVISSCSGTRQLAPPVDARVARALEGGGHDVRRGAVLVACRADADRDALAEIHRLGLDCQLIYNRAELMILPAGISKGAGLVTALGDLGLSPHSAIAIGDAENDLSLVEHCELGVAVANAVPSLKDRADVVMDDPDGAGVAAFLDGEILAGTRRVHPRRWHVTLGSARGGEPVEVSASQVNVLIAGGTRSGKSYLTGLFAEQLLKLGYAVVVIDPEGDHASLGQLPRVMVVGGGDPLPDVDHLARIAGTLTGGVVVDLSQLSRPDKEAYYLAGPARLSVTRAALGLPHWLIFDEAHESLGESGIGRAAFEPSRKGHCLVTHRPDLLCREAADDLDIFIAMPHSGSPDDDHLSSALATFTGIGQLVIEAELASVGPGEALLARRDRPGVLQAFTPAARRTTHVRHWHKYLAGTLAWERRFHFRASPDRETGAVAANLTEFHRELRRCDPRVISHHGRHGDFSRWIDGVLADQVLARRFRDVEAALDVDSDPEPARIDLLAALEDRYLG